MIRISSPAKRWHPSEKSGLAARDYHGSDLLLGSGALAIPVAGRVTITDESNSTAFHEKLVNTFHRGVASNSASRQRRAVSFQKSLRKFADRREWGLRQPLAFGSSRQIGRASCRGTA